MLVRSPGPWLISHHKQLRTMSCILRVSCLVCRRRHVAFFLALYHFFFASFFFVFFSALRFFFHFFLASFFSPLRFCFVFFSFFFLASVLFCFVFFCSFRSLLNRSSKSMRPVRHTQSFKVNNLSVSPLFFSFFGDRLFFRVILHRYHFRLLFCMEMGTLYCTPASAEVVSSILTKVGHRYHFVSFSVWRWVRCILHTC